MNTNFNSDIANFIRKPKRLCELFETRMLIALFMMCFTLVFKAYMVYCTIATKWDCDEIKRRMGGK
jgi:hypothetical protein